MIGMEKKRHAGKISSRVPSRLASEIRAWTGLVGDDLRFTGRRMGLEDLVGWVLYDFMSKPESERIAILENAGPRVEDMRASDPTPLADSEPKRVLKGVGSADVSGRKVKTERK